jgi:hypothetical protein
MSSSSSFETGVGVDMRSSNHKLCGWECFLQYYYDEGVKKGRKDQGMLTAQVLLNFAQYSDSFMPGGTQASPVMKAMYGNLSVQSVLRDFVDFGVGLYTSPSGCQSDVQHWHQRGWIKGKQDVAARTALHLEHYAKYLDSFTHGAIQASPDMLYLYSNSTVQEVLREYAEFVAWSCQ